MHKVSGILMKNGFYPDYSLQKHLQLLLLLLGMFESHKARCTFSSVSCKMIRYGHSVLGVLQAMCSSLSPNIDTDFLNTVE